MEECRPILNTGLRGFVVATTRISDVDGTAGKLVYRGYLVKDLAEKTCFEEAAHLLLYEKLPNKAELSSFKQQLATESPLPPEVVAALKTLPKDTLPMDVLQAGISLMAPHDPDLGDNSHEAAMRKAVRLIAKMPTLVTAWERIRNGKEPLAPLPEHNMATNFLYMLKGELPAEEVARFFDVGLVLHAEHSFNASTFAAREVASTRAHIYAAVGAAIGSLSGELHGGANVRVMEMLLKIGNIDAIDDYIQNTLQAGKLIFGLGHAIYQVDDPRALILSPMSQKMGELSGQRKWYDMSVELEKKAKAAFKKHKGIDIFLNVDFYSASLFYAMGIPLDLFSPVFAISRMAGWTAHVLEEQFAEAAPKPVLYRPESEYIGDYCGPEECTFTPIEKR